MLAVCAWCRAALGDRPPRDDPRTTHGICPACLARVAGDAGLDLDLAPPDPSPPGDK